MGISFTDLQPGQFAATSIEGGLPKLVRIWEELRRLNKGGYGGAVLVQLGDFTKASAEGVTSCSPFTCTAICMALDPRSVDVGQPYTLGAPYKPAFDGGRPVDHYFYDLHNGYPRSHYLAGKQWRPDFKKGYVDEIPQLESAFSLFNSAAGSVVALNLGTPVDPKAMRRGDVLGWDWNPKKVIVKGKEQEIVHGHAACIRPISSDGTSRSLASLARGKPDPGGRWGRPAASRSNDAAGREKDHVDQEQ